MDTHAKGSRYALMRMRALERDGWSVYKAPMTRRTKDIFGLFDLVAYKSATVRFEQVKAYRMHGKERDNFLVLMREFSHPFEVSGGEKYVEALLVMWDKVNKKWDELR